MYRYTKVTKHMFLYRVFLLLHGLKTPVDTQLQDLSVLAKYMPMFETFADSPESSGTTKAFIKYLRSQAE